MDVTEITTGMKQVTGQQKSPVQTELKKTAQDFAAIFYEIMFKEVMKTNTETKGLQEVTWWDMFAEEVSQEAVAVPNAMVESLYRQMQKNQDLP